MPLERYDVAYPLWRKKVDGSLLLHSETPVAQMWSIRSLFPRKGSRRNSDSQVKLRFQNRSFSGAVTWHRRKHGAKAYRLWFEKALTYALSEAFVMTNMRELEGRLRAAAGDLTDLEREIPFWEFLDIEFDSETRTFYLKAYYTQRPSFPALFGRMIDAPPLKRIRDELAGKIAPRIHKQNWRPRAEFELEVGATNVIYMLADTRRRLFYVGEADAFITRLRRGHDPIPKWDYYRYDALPTELERHRIQIERMVIRDIDSLLGVSAKGLPILMSQFKLVNTRIDR